MTDSSNLPKVIYHYCGLTGFHGILQSKTLWLSDAYFMNDYMEHKWLLEKAMKRVKNFAREPKHTGACEELKHVNLLRIAHPYVCCFSMQKDSLSQWRAYSDDGAGFAVGFATEKLCARCDEHKAKGHNIMLGPVVYDGAEQDAMIDAILDRFLGGYAKQALTQDSDFFDLAWRTHQELWQAAALSKNQGFAEEQEYRVILRPAMKRRLVKGLTLTLAGTSKQYFRVSGSRLVPYYTFPFQGSDVVEIRVGPKYPDRDWHHVLKMFLDQNGYRTATSVLTGAVSC